jgi:hypothetical protein
MRSKGHGRQRGGKDQRGTTPVRRCRLRHERRNALHLGFSLLKIDLGDAFGSSLIFVKYLFFARVCSMPFANEPG